MGAFRTSALNGYNVENAINFLVDDIINKIENNKSNNTHNASIKLNETKEEQKSKRCCWDYTIILFFNEKIIKWFLL